MRTRFLIAIALVAAILLPNAADAHQGYYSCTAAPRSSCAPSPDFYVSAGAGHYIQQTYPDNQLCYHRVYHVATGQLVFSTWLRGNNDTDPAHQSTPNYFRFGHNQSTSQKFHHTVSQCSGTVQVYMYH